MPLPRWVARFNKKITNRFMEPLARRFANFAVVHHIGRASGRSYTTPVNYFSTEPAHIVVALTYGPGADWVRNVVASGGSIEVGGKLVAISESKLVGRPAAWPYLPGSVKIALRVLRVHDFVEMRIGPDPS